MASENPNVDPLSAAQNPSKSSVNTHPSAGDVGPGNVVAAYFANSNQDGDDEHLLAQEAQIEASWRAGSTRPES